MAVWPKLGLALTAGAALAAPGAAAPSQPTAAQASHLLFASNRDGDGDAYATDPAGRRYAALTVDSEDERNFVPSQDGRHLAFRRTRSGAVYVADGAGRHLRNVGEGFPVGWSPDGSRLAFLSQEGAEASGIRVVNADGTGVRTLVDDGGSFTEFEGWSADGQELAFTIEAVDPETGDINSELRTVDLAGSQRLLHSHLGETWYSATWSPSSHELAYRRFEPVSQIAVVDADSGTTSVAATADGLGGPVWSPDGTKLLFSRGDGAGHYSLAVTELASGITSQLVSTGPIAYEQSASYSWSPAGNRVVWLDAKGLFDVRADGQGRTRLRRAPWIGWPPGVGKATWSPSGDALAFEEGGLRSIRPDGTGLKTLADRGSIELLAWVQGPVPAAAPRAASLPPLELASTRLLRSRGRIRELVAAGALVGVVSSRSKLDCAHVLAWAPPVHAVARASQPAPCGLFLQPRETVLGGLRMSGASLRWSGDWSCGNTECDHVTYHGVVRSPRRMAVQRKFVVVTYDGSLPNLPCVVCGQPIPLRSSPDRVPGVAVAYVGDNAIVVKLIRTGTTRLIRPPAVGPVFARLTRAGLFYGYSLGGGAYPGRVAFVPLASLYAAGRRSDR